MSKQEKAIRGGSDQPTFEQAIARLERIVRDLEEGEIDLSQSLACYEEGVGLLRKCHRLLAGAKRKIELLSGIDPLGEPETEPFDDESSLSLSEKQSTRSRRRTAARRPKPAPDDETMDEKPGLF